MVIMNNQTLQLLLIKELCARDHYADVMKYRGDLDWAANLLPDKRNDYDVLQFFLSYVDRYGKTPPDYKAFYDYLCAGGPGKPCDGALGTLESMADIADTDFTDIDQLVSQFFESVKIDWAVKGMKAAATEVAQRGVEKTRALLDRHLDRIPSVSASPELEPHEIVVSTVRQLDDEEEMRTTHLTVIDGQNIKPVAIDWWWEDRFALGKIAWLAGLPGTGKTMVMLDAAARITTGRDFPDRAKNTLGPRRVMIAMSEDGLADTIVPRLMAAGADMTKVSFLNRVTSDVDNRTPNLQDDISHLRNALRQYPDTVLLIMDPMTNYFGSDVNINVDKEARPVMTALKKLCEEFKIGFMGVIHNNKQTDANAIQKILGCSSIVGAARSVYGCSVDPDDKSQRYFTFIKGNCTAKTAGIKYSVETEVLDGKIKTAVVQWGEQTEDTAEDVLKRERDVRYERKQNKQIDLAQAFIPFFLKGKGRVPSTEVYAAAEAQGISGGMIKSAIKKFFSANVIREGPNKGGIPGWTMRWVDEEKVLPAEVAL